MPARRDRRLSVLANPAKSGSDPAPFFARLATAWFARAGWL
jgi:hypothetical protein